MSLVRAAQRWHDNQRAMHIAAQEYGSCWCCCNVCNEENPFAPLARYEMKAEKKEEEK